MLTLKTNYRKVVALQCKQKGVSYSTVGMLLLYWQFFLPWRHIPKTGTKKQNALTSSSFTENTTRRSRLSSEAIVALVSRRNAILKIESKQSKPNHEQRKSTKTMSIPLDYLVIIDLEATSDDQTDPQRAEIVEFPFTVFSLATAQPVDNKQIYIHPRWNTNPNPPRDAVPPNPDVIFVPTLAEALLQFDAYIYHSFILPSKSFYLLFDGHWDLTCLLFGEASRKALVLAPHFRSYINLRHEFSKCYPSAPIPKDRKTMFDYLAISVQQRRSGIEECHALAELVTRMLNDGHTFTQPVVVNEYDWATLPARIPAVATSVAAAVPVGGVVKLRGLPWTSTEADVEAFLAGIRIVPSGVHFVKTPQGKATGQAFVQLESSDGVAMALARHKQNVGERYIEVFRSSVMDMANCLGRADARRHMYAHGKGELFVTSFFVIGLREWSDAILVALLTSVHLCVCVCVCVMGVMVSIKARASSAKNRRKEVAGASLNSFVVRVTGLPKCITSDELLPLFNGLELTGEGIHILRVDGECTGEAFVELVSEAWGKKALQRSGGSVTSGGVTLAVEIRKSSQGQMRGALNETEGKAGSPGIRWYIRIRGIGDDVSEKTLVDMYDAFRVREDDVVIQHEKRERTARVCFGTREVRDAALGVKPWDGAPWVIEDGGNGRRRETSSPCVVRMRGLPYTSNEEDIAHFFEGYTIAPGGITRGKDRHGRASGEAWVTFLSPEDARDVVDKLDKAHMGNRYIELKF